MPENREQSRPPASSAAQVCLVERTAAAGRRLAAAIGEGSGVEVKVFEGPAALLEHVARAPVHVVVVADDLPDLGCTAALRQVQLRHPEVVRVVLTDRDAVEVFRRVPYAHQFFARSTPPNALVVTVRQCLELRRLLGRPELRALVSSTNSLPAAPQLYTELIDLLADPRCSMLKVVSVIERDVGMSSRLMQLVSSAFFGLSTQITSLGACVGYLGLNTIRSLVLSAEISQLYPGALSGFSVEQIHTRALATARLARRMAASIADEGQAFIAGLLHGVGQLVLASRAPSRFGEALELCNTRGISQPEAELEVLGATSAEVGAYLLALWGQPLEVVRAIAHQDMPQSCDSTRPGLATLLYLGKRLSEDTDVPLGPPSPASNVLDEPFLGRVGLLEALPRLRDVARRLSS